MDTTRNANEEIKILLENSPLGFVLTNATGKLLYANPSLCHMLGYTEQELLSKAVPELTHPDSIAVSVATVKQVFAGSGPKAVEKKYLHKDGSVVHAITRVAAVFADDGSPLYQCTSIENITERLQTEKKLETSKRRAEQIVETALDSIIEFDEVGAIHTCNSAAEQTFGWRRTELAAMSIYELIDSWTSQRTDFQSWINNSRDDQTLVTHRELVGIRKNGQQFPIEGSISAYIDNEKRYYNLFVRDITERKRAEERQQFFATHDHLTGLPNRTLFVDVLNQVIAASERKRHFHAVFFVDLDDFKKINDSLGHHAGDLMLKEVSTRLSRAMRRGDLIARMGGDEFTILAQYASDDEQVITLAKKIIEIISEPFTIYNTEVNVSPSIGITVYPAHGDNADTLLKNADLAMYKAKTLGRNNYQFFSQEMNKEVSRRIEMEAGLRGAIANDQLDVLYQPQFDATNQEIVGVEALTRWPLPNGNAVRTEDFIAIAEKSGIIRQLGKYVLEKVCIETKPYFDNGGLTGRVAVNVSPLQFSQPKFFDEVIETLARTKFDPNWLEIEITESAIIQDFSSARDLVVRFKAHGITIALDDFGMGYSSLSYLQTLPVDRLKVDRTFVADVTGSGKAKQLVEFIVQMAHSLELDVVAEGVETLEQLETLQRMSCDKVQGYYFSKPRRLCELISQNESLEIA